MYYSKIVELNQVYHKMKEGKVQEALQDVMKLEKNKNLSPKEILSYKLVKANLFRVLGNTMEAIKICKAIYPEFEQMGDLLSAFDVLLIQTYCYLLMAEINKSELLFKQAQDLFIMIKEKFSIDLNDRESFLLRINSGIHFFKGEIHEYLNLNMKAYKLAKNTGDKSLISTSLSNIAHAYMQMNEFDKALVYVKAAVDLNFKPSLSGALANLIEIYINKGEIKEAEASLDILRDFVKSYDIGADKMIYLYAKAMILKSSLRSRNRIESEDLFSSVASAYKSPAEYRINAILNLCDLYLTELKFTNDLEIINEIHPFIQELLVIAQNQHLHLILAETYLLQAKLSILTFDIKKAQVLLTQAQRLAESHGLDLLAMKISNEHDNLLIQTKLWKGDAEISLSERLELANLKEQMEYMSRKRILEVPEQKNEESVLFLILTEGGNPIYSHWFIKEKNLEDHLFGGFLSSINAFIKEIFSEGLDRASFGKYTLLMKSISPFLICYIFKGPSYYAIQRVKLLNSKIKSNEEVWQTLQHFYQTNRIIQTEDIPYLNLMINKIFIEKSFPSKEKISSS